MLGCTEPDTTIIGVGKPLGGLSGKSGPQVEIHACEQAHGGAFPIPLGACAVGGVEPFEEELFRVFVQFAQQLRKSQLVGFQHECFGDRLHAVNAPAQRTVAGRDAPANAVVHEVIGCSSGGDHHGAVRMPWLPGSAVRSPLRGTG
jgi:hypothetical protein